MGLWTKVDGKLSIAATNVPKNRSTIQNADIDMSLQRQSCVMLDKMKQSMEAVLKVSVDKKTVFLSSISQYSAGCL